MKAKRYFKKDNELVEVINGRYGAYGRRFGFNYSEKQLLESGFEVVSLTTEEESVIREARRKEETAIAKAEYERNMQDRYEQVDICLASEPLEIVPNEVGSQFVAQIANITGGMQDAYHGCGKGTAYVRDGKVVAFHYGYEAPSNAPEGDAQRIELSCYQICF